MLSKTLVLGVAALSLAAAPVMAKTPKKAAAADAAVSGPSAPIPYDQLQHDDAPMKADSGKAAHHKKGGGHHKKGGAHHKKGGPAAAPAGAAPAAAPAPATPPGQ